MSVASWYSTCFCVVLCVGFCTGHFVTVPLNLTYLHCLQRFFCDHRLNLYWDTALLTFHRVNLYIIEYLKQKENEV